MSILELFDLKVQTAYSNPQQITTAGHTKRYHKLMQMVHPDKLNNELATNLAQTVQLCWKITNDCKLFMSYCHNRKEKTMEVEGQAFDLEELHKLIKIILKMDDTTKNSPATLTSQKSKTRMPPVPRGMKRRIQSIKSHIIRKDRGTISFKTIWTETGRVETWERLETVMAHPQELREYLNKTKLKVRLNLMRREPELRKIIENSENQDQ